MKNQVELAHYDNSWFDPGGTRLKRVAWFLLGSPLVRSAWIPSSAMRVWLLRGFGATIGRGVVLKPSLEVKYPWHLAIGDHSWVGEHVWIDNLTTVQLGSNVCVSQGAYLCTGNHDWSDPNFGLRVNSIIVEDGGWIGAKAILTPGTHLGVCAVAGAGSVVSGRVPDTQIYAGNPACFVRLRSFRRAAASPSSQSCQNEPESVACESSSTILCTRGNS